MMRMVTVSMRSMSTPWKAFGRGCVLGGARIGGISLEKLPIYLGFFEFVHNVRRRGRALLGSLLDTLLQPVACPQNPI